MTTSTFPTNNDFKASCSSLIPVINSNSSSLILTIFDDGKNSKIASRHAFGDSHNGKRTLGSKLMIPLCFVAYSIAFL